MLWLSLRKDVERTNLTDWSGNQNYCVRRKLDWWCDAIINDIRQQLTHALLSVSLTIVDRLCCHCITLWFVALVDQDWDSVWQYKVKTKLAIKNALFHNCYLIAAGKRIFENTGLHTHIYIFFFILINWFLRRCTWISKQARNAYKIMFVNMNSTLHKTSLITFSNQLQFYF